MMISRRGLLSAFGRGGASQSSEQMVSQASAPSSTAEWRFSIKDFGAVGDGVTDDTVPIMAAFRAAMETAPRRYPDGIGQAFRSMNRGIVFVPPGVYRYSGPSLAALGNSSAGSIGLIGAGEIASTIVNEGKDYLVEIGSSINSLTISDLCVIGGPGLVRGLSRGIHVRRHFIVERCTLLDMTECAIGHDAEDMPHWRIRDCHFWLGLERQVFEATAIALSGLTDGCIVEGNEFVYCRYSLKLDCGGNNTYVERNFFSGCGESDGADLWIVPQIADRGGINSGQGCIVRSNKFGNEKTEGRRRILVAEQEVGRDFLNSAHSYRDTGGWVVGIQITENLFGGRSRVREGIILSSIAKVNGLRFFRNSFVGTVHPYVMEFSPGILEPDFGTWGDNLVEFDSGADAPFVRKDGTVFDRRVEPSNRPSMWPTASQGGMMSPGGQRWERVAGEAVEHVGPGELAVNGIQSAEIIELSEPEGEVTMIRFEDARAIVHLSIPPIQANVSYWCRLDLRQAEAKSPVRVAAWLVGGVGFKERVFGQSLELPSEWQTVQWPILVGSASPLLTGPVVLEFRPSGGPGSLLMRRVSVQRAMVPAETGDLRTLGLGAWDEAHLKLGSFHIWIDLEGDLRIKRGQPTSDMDGKAVGR